MVQSYNAAGQVLETKVVVEDLAAILPAEMKTQLLAEPGAAEELKHQLAALLGARAEMFKTSYIYDTEGQLTEKRDHLGYNLETVTSFVYDGNGNKVEEHATTSGDANPPRNEAGTQGAAATAPRIPARIRNYLPLQVRELRQLDRAGHAVQIAP